MCSCYGANESVLKSHTNMRCVPPQCLKFCATVSADDSFDAIISRWDGFFANIVKGFNPQNPLLVVAVASSIKLLSLKYAAHENNV